MLIAIVGPTGTGKSRLSIDLATALEARGRRVEIVNADAMQLYRGMDVGTAKLPPEQRGGITHHLLDVLEPREEASVARYQREARAIVDDVVARGAVPVLVGGSGLYVSSVVYDFQFPGTDPDVRARLDDELEQQGPGVLHRRLRDADPAAADAIGPHNGRRLVRALEVIELTGGPFGAGLPAETQTWRPTLTIGLREDRAVLVDRLDARVRQMWSDGIVDEVERLRPAGLGTTASRAIGYAQALAQLDGTLDAAQAMEQTAALTRRYARRQVSWFGRYRDTHWLESRDPERTRIASDLVEAALDAAEPAMGRQRR